ncbi:hypothetical protein J2S43_007874 [Catenuloplanes nepalensis]|uniref:MerR family transcriptional regulator n=1 Tax=Catenuloplanes nepalensis TaxID=587533 RepID=A0ABT9N6N5_9ACTN|nr:hypothetical protein [Catenuloplanes nepalensis]MDP9799362.1 hypothetical protein [Catenuloplanes nepalensis]
MIMVAGETWGTAAEIADHIGQGVTADTVRWWGRNDGLASVRMADEDGRPRVRYILGQAIRIDQAKRLGGRGRRRTGLTDG